MKNKVEYKLEAYEIDIFDDWKEYNIDYIVENFWDDILLIQNNWRYENIFQDSKINTYTESLSIYWVDLEINDLEECEYEVNNYEDEGKNENRIKKWIKNHTIEICASWYSQSDYDCYYILIEDLNKKEKIEKQLKWLERIFTISDTRVILYKREIVEKNGKKYYGEWEEIDAIETEEELPNVEKMALELCKRNGIEDTSDIVIPTEASYVDYY